MKKINKQSGFTTVELLVTLFVAAAFLMSGYQLYAMIIKNNGEASARAKAVNVAYQYLQQYKDKYKNDNAINCATNPTILTNPVTPAIDGLSNVTITPSFTCPYSSASDYTKSISKLSITVTYNNPQQQITDATYVNKK
jgi:type II secretory pathway pseudopilin PulG